MEIVHLSRAEIFSPEKLQKNVLFNSPYFFCDLYCLNPGQAQKVHAHPSSDKIYLVMKGSATITLDEETATLNSGEGLLCPAGCSHGVSNHSDQSASILVIMAPKPI